MEIENKDFYNQSLKGILKMQLGVWRPFTIHPVLLWPVFATHISFVDKYFVRHTHYEQFIIISLEKGVLEIISQGKAYLLHEGETAFIPPGPHTLTAVNGNTLHHTLGIEGYLVRMILEGLLPGLPAVVKNFYTPEYAELFEEIYTLLNTKDPRHTLKLSLLAYNIFMYIISHTEQKQLPPELLASEEYIRNNLSKKISLKDLCSSAGCGKTFLNKSFMQFFNTTAANHIRTCRINEAKKLLTASPELPIKLIAEKCGYQNQFHFARDFKKITDHSPTAYRKTFLS